MSKSIYMKGRNGLKKNNFFLLISSWINTSLLFLILITNLLTNNYRNLTLYIVLSIIALISSIVVSTTVWFIRK